MSIDLKSIVNKLNAKWAKESKMPEGSAPRIQIASSIPPPNLVSTGIPALDRMLDGGVPEGEIICYYGDPGGGKTTSACLLAAEIQKLGGAVLWYQTESGFPEEGLRLAGVDKDRFIHIPAVGYGEDGFNIIKDILMDGKVPREEIKLVVVDSVAGLEPSNEANSVEENGLEGNTIGVHARMMSKFFRVLTGQGLLRGGCICCLINQERSQISSVPMPATQTGGRAVQYGAKIMVRFAKPKAELIKDSKGTIVGHTVKLEVTKNNTGYGAPYATGSYRAIYKDGIDKIDCIMEEALDTDIIQQGGSWLQVRYINAEGKLELGDKIQGKDSLRKKMTEDARLLTLISDSCNKVRSVLRTRRYRVFNGVYVLKSTGEVVDLLSEYVNPTKEPVSISSSVEDIRSENTEVAIRDEEAFEMAKASVQSLIDKHLDKLDHTEDEVLIEGHPEVIQ